MKSERTRRQLKCEPGFVRPTSNKIDIKNWLLQHSETGTKMVVQIVHGASRRCSSTSAILKGGDDDPETSTLEELAGFSFSQTGDLQAPESWPSLELNLEHFERLSLHNDELFAEFGNSYLDPFIA